MMLSHIIKALKNEKVSGCNVIRNELWAFKIEGRCLEVPWTSLFNIIIKCGKASEEYKPSTSIQVWLPIFKKEGKKDWPKELQGYNIFKLDSKIADDITIKKIRAVFENKRK